MKLGLIGGTGPVSTMPYYLGVVYGVQEKVDPRFFPNLTIESVNVFHILDMCRDGKFDELTDYLLEAVNNLVRAGAEIVALTANTSHIVYDALQEKSPVPIVSIIESTCREAQRRGYTKVGLLGTMFTMTGHFYRKPFAEAGIDLVTPDTADMEYVDRKISEELEYNIVKEETLRRFQEIITNMRERDGIEAVILGCTELPILLNDTNTPVPCLDTVHIHIKDLVSAVLDSQDEVS